VTWIGHATFLITVAGKNILTDPIFGDLGYIVNFKRLTPPGVALHALPPIDAVLISHNHPDHMDEATLHILEQLHSPLFLVPQGDKLWFDKRGFKRVQECMWWDNYKLSSMVNCTFLPAIHWSRRGFFDHNRSLWGSWMIESSMPHPTTIYFGGDTAYGSHFKAIAEAYPKIDVALMPIGPAEPRKLMRCSHVNPEEAGQAFLDLGADTLIPMHWGAYHLGTEEPLVPLHRMRSWWNAYVQSKHDRRLSCLKMGETFGVSPHVFIPGQQLESAHFETR
jgi:L-ascorbate metabolism protein UlaG (beta-lactamase superfamily)